MRSAAPAKKNRLATAALIFRLKTPATYRCFEAGAAMPAADFSKPSDRKSASYAREATSTKAFGKAELVVRWSGQHEARGDGFHPNLVNGSQCYPVFSVYRWKILWNRETARPPGRPQGGPKWRRKPLKSHKTAMKRSRCRAQIGRRRLPADQRRAPGEASAHRLDHHEVARLDPAVLDRDRERQRHRGG